MVSFSHIEQYSLVTMTFMVDNVCLYEGKQQEVREHYEGVIANLVEAGADEATIAT